MERSALVTCWTVSFSLFSVCVVEQLPLPVQTIASGTNDRYRSKCCVSSFTQILLDCLFVFVFFALKPDYDECAEDVADDVSSANETTDNSSAPNCTSPDCPSKLNSNPWIIHCVLGRDLNSRRA